jgi:DNA adenine methylase
MNQLNRVPFGYFGAKAKIASKIIELLPRHAAWVETFCGSAAITCLKNPAPIEIINDKDDNIVTFFRVMRTDLSRLLKAIAFTPYAKKEWELAQEDYASCSDLEKARRFLVKTMMTVNGTLGKKSGFSFSDSYSRNGCEARVSRWINLPERLKAVAKRLSKVRIENRDAITLVERFSNRPASLLYLDPPYLGERTKGYNVEAFEPEFHSALLNKCLRSNSMILISGYDNPIYRDALNLKSGWTRLLIETTTREVTGRDLPRTEVLWMNKHFTAAKRNGSIPIILSKKEKLNKKVNPARIFP